MRYHYVAINQNGSMVEGDFDAQNTNEVFEYLGKNGLKPISLKKLKEFEKQGSFNFFGQSVTIADKIFLTRYLALMLKVGTDLFKALDILIADFEKPAVKALLLEMRMTLEKGQPFYSAFAKYPKVFSSVFVNLIKAGETSGNLEKIFEDLSFSLQKEQELRHRIKAALMYPVILLIVSALILILLVSFALPKIAEIFTSGGINPPTFSKIVFAVGIFLGKYMFIILGFFSVIVLFLWYIFAKTLAGRLFFYRFILKIPVVGNVLKQIALQRFAATLSSLLAAGMSIIDSLEITANAVGSEEIKNALVRISREGISKGLTIGEAFRKEPAFPRVIVNLMAISEKAGHVENILSTLSTFYEAEIDSSIKSLVAFLEPMLLLMIGTIIGTIALSIIIPIYQLVGQF